MRRGKKTIETDISFPASKVWQVYSTLELPEIIRNIPNYVKDLKVTGDGSVGITYYDIWNLPDAPYEWYKEKVTRLDQEELIKEVDAVEGGVLNFGFTFFRTKFEILSKGANQCTVKSSVMYEIEDKYADNEKMATADDLATIAQAVEEYLRKKEAGGGSLLDTGLGTGDGSAPEFNTGGLPG